MATKLILKDCVLCYVLLTSILHFSFRVTFVDTFVEHKIVNIKIVICTIVFNHAVLERKCNFVTCVDYYDSDHQ